MDNLSVPWRIIIEGLGNSPDQIAANLQAQGIQGVRNTVRFLNPIVRFVRGALPLRHLDMDLIQAGVLRIILPAGQKVEASLTQAVRDFLKDFNQGAYPELEMSMEKAEHILLGEENGYPD